MNKQYIDELKNKYKTLGINFLSKREILELLLSYGIPYRKIPDVADTLLKRFGDLDCIFERSPQTLLETPGMSSQAAIMLNMQSSLFRTCSIEAEFNKINVLTAENREQFIRSLFIGHNTELFYAVSMSAKGKILKTDLLSSGTVNRTNVYTRRVIELAFQRNAAKMLFVHNHPNGIPLPSAEDAQITYKLHDALKTIDVEFVDHIIVTDDTMISLVNDMHIFQLRQSSYDVPYKFE